MAIKLDTSDHTIVCHCTTCPSWVELFLNRAAAWQAAYEHMRQVHPDDVAGVNSAATLNARHNPRHAVSIGI